ncbi:MAG TPA: hypothetical protein VFD82_01155 [Planctomycetota bacterium]|nr:hypothetical protein [Planctomycetota bacterium]
MRDRWLVLSVAAYYAIALTVRLSVDDAGVWYWLFFPTTTANPVFLDASILIYGSKCGEEGFALYEPNACLNGLLGTPGYVFNYPPYLTGLAAPFATETGIAAFSIFQAALFLCACCAVVSKITDPTARRTSYLLLITYPVSLVIERGNYEQLTFALVVLFCFLASSGKPSRQIAGLIALAVAGAAKLLPFAAAAALLRRPFQLACIAVVAGSIYYSNADAIASIARVTMQETLTSFGLVQLSTLNGAPWLVVMTVAALVSGAIVGRSAARQTALSQSLAIAGTSIVALAYFTMLSWDYRLINLLMCLPAITSSVRRPWLAVLYYGVMSWASSFGHHIFALDELMVAGLLGYCCALSAKALLRGAADVPQAPRRPVFGSGDPR